MVTRSMVLGGGGIGLLVFTLLVSATLAPPVNVSSSSPNEHFRTTAQAGTTSPAGTTSNTGTTSKNQTKTSKRSSSTSASLDNGTLIGVQGGGPGWHQDGSVQYVRNGTVKWSITDPNGSYFGVEPLQNGSVVAAFMASGYQQCGPYSAPCARTGYRIIDPTPTPHIVYEWSFPVRTAKNSEVHKAVPLSNGGMLMTDMEHERIIIVKHGQITWQWDASSFYNPPKDPTKRDWLHINDVNRIGPRKYLVSVRNANQLLVIQRDGNSSKILQVINKDRSSANDGSCKQPGQLVPNASGAVRCGNPKVLNHQHNPQWLGNGKVLVADSDNNRVVELTHQSNGSWRPIWALYGAGGLSLRWPRDADRLPNGDTLITDSLHKRVIEVNSAGDVVWSVGTKQIPYSADRLPYGESWILNNSKGNTTATTPTNHSVVNGSNVTSNRSNTTQHQTTIGTSSPEKPGSIVAPNGGPKRDVPVLSTLLVGLKAVFPMLPYWFAIPQLSLSIVSIVLIGAGIVDRIKQQR